MGNESVKFKSVEGMFRSKNKSKRSPALRQAMRDIRDHKLLSGGGSAGAAAAGASYLALKLLDRMTVKELDALRYARLLHEYNYLVVVLENSPEGMDDAEAARYLEMISERIMILMGSTLFHEPKSS